MPNVQLIGSSLGFFVIFVLVGPKENLFTIHRNLVIAKSAFFKKALADARYKESWQGVVRLPEQDPEGFDIYVKCLYNGKIFSAQDDGDISSEFRRLASVALLSDFLQDIGTFNFCVDAIIDVAQATDQYPLTLAALVYEQLPPCSHLRRLIRDFWVWHPNPQWYDGVEGGDPEHDVEAAPCEFWRNVSRESAVMGAKAFNEQVKNPWTKDRCQYHQHPNGERCDRGFS
jgi:hypothetical protein